MTLQSRRRPIEILLVEDNPGDARLTREAFADASVSNNLSVVGDGEQAMAFLRREGDYAGAPRPDLILLDLNLPRKSGREVLEDVKTDPRLAVHSHRGDDHFGSRRGHRQLLLSPRQRVRHQTG